MRRYTLYCEVVGVVNTAVLNRIIMIACVCAVLLLCCVLYCCAIRLAMSCVVMCCVARLCEGLRVCVLNYGVVWVCTMLCFGLLSL